MKKIVILILGIIYFSYAGDSIFITKEKPIALPLEDKNFYVGLSITQLELLNKNSLESFSTQALTFHSGYIYNKYLSIEAQYSHSVTNVVYDGGSSGIDNNYPTTFTNIAIYLKPSYRILDFNVYSLLGYGQVKLTNIPKGDVSRSEIGFQWGVGVEYHINPNISIFSNFVYLYKGKGFDYRATSDDIDTTSLNIGINYYF